MGRESAYPACWSAGVAVTLADGRRLFASQDRPKGDPENPLSETELAAKFCELAAYGGWSAAQAQAAIDWLRRLTAPGFLDTAALRTSTR
jgi:2-methylcitrate dehydratase PrpD